MEVWLAFEVVASGKMDDYKAWFEARDKRFQELGMARLKMYQVPERTSNMVCVISPEMTSEEVEQWAEAHDTDEVIQKLARERREKKVLVDGTTEFFRLTV